MKPKLSLLAALCVGAAFFLECAGASAADKEYSGYYVEFTNDRAIVEELIPGIQIKKYDTQTFRFFASELRTVNGTEWTGPKGNQPHLYRVFQFKWIWTVAQDGEKLVATTFVGFQLTINTRQFARAYKDGDVIHVRVCRAGVGPDGQVRIGDRFDEFDRSIEKTVR